MILTILSHVNVVRILFIIGITVIVLPIFLYRLTKGKNVIVSKSRGWAVFAGVVMCLPFVYYTYLDIRYKVSEYTLDDKLCLAVENENYSAAVTLLKEGANPDAMTRYEVTSAYRAVMLDDAQMVKLLLDRGADPNEAANESVTMLSLAAKNQNNEIVQMLIDAGADPDYMPQKFVPTLHYAGANDNEYNAELVQMLIDAGADPTSQAYREGKVMLPFRYYFDEYTDDDDITDEDAANYQKIYDMLYQPYIDWLKVKMQSENERMEIE